MNYKINTKNGNKLSQLGFGCMRLTKKGPHIDQEKAERELLFAIENGINYFDCAYIYPGIENCLGKFFSKGYRDKAYIATKLPHYFVKASGGLDRYFDEQLKRLQTDYIDYYMMHMLSDLGSWNRMLPYGVEVWARSKKESGQIRNFGFSFHGGTVAFKAIIDAYDWDFCMIQYNYIDETSQAGVSGLRYAREKGIPVMIMEPLRGGRLTNKLPKEAHKLIEDYPEQRSAAEWAFRWLFSQEEVTVVLSGMNSLQQLRENINTASLDYSAGLSTAEQKLYSALRGAIRKNTAVPCTGCAYCMPCPKGVDIPVCFNCLNEYYSEGWFAGMKDYIMCTTLRTETAAASKCVKCGKCETHCPQHIEIRNELERVVKKLETPVYKIARRAAKFMGYNIGK